MTESLFARHGNTFGPGDKVGWVGRASDLPLVERGLEQAHAAARWLRAHDLIPNLVISGTLKRTRGFAEIVAGDLGIKEHCIDSRLDEIDYGAWEGLSSDEIARLPGGAAAEEAWRTRDVWPENAGWISTEAEILGALGTLLADLAAGAGGPRPLVVGSNGVLRFVPKLLGATVEGATQLKTGALGHVAREGQGWTVRGWGVTPE